MKKQRRTLEELGRDIFSPEFLQEADAEYRRMEIIATDHEHEWTDWRLPDWEFYRATGGELFVGCNNDLGLTVQGDTEREVQEAAGRAQTQALSEQY